MLPPVCIGRKVRASTAEVHEFLKQRRWFVAKRLCNLTELDYVQAALTSLHLRDKALGLSQPFGELDLSDAGGLSR